MLEQDAGAGASPAKLRYTTFDDSPASTHNRVVALVPEGAAVLEFGCATGYMSEVLASRRDATVTGIEIVPEAAARAAEHCERVIVGDADELDYDEALGGERFDAVVFADVLEHLKEPGAVLRRIRPFLADGGVVIASIPNIAHASVRLALLAGKFRYREQGLLDETHLRFFTRESIQDLFEGAGYLVTHWDRRRLELAEAEIAVPADVPEAARRAVAADPEATTYQFIVRAVPAGATEQLHVLRADLRHAHDELAALRASSDELASARDELEQLRPVAERAAQLDAELAATQEELAQLRTAHEVRGRRLIAERVAFADRLAEAQAAIYGSRSWRYTAPMRAFLSAFKRGG